MQSSGDSQIPPTSPSRGSRRSSSDGHIVEQGNQRSLAEALLADSSDSGPYFSMSSRDEASTISRRLPSESRTRLGYRALARHRGQHLLDQREPYAQSAEIQALFQGSRSGRDSHESSSPSSSEKQSYRSPYQSRASSPGEPTQPGFSRATYSLSALDPDRTLRQVHFHRRDHSESQIPEQQPNLLGEARQGHSQILSSASGSYREPLAEADSSIARQEEHTEHFTGVSEKRKIDSGPDLVAHQTTSPSQIHLQHKNRLQQILRLSRESGDNAGGSVADIGSRGPSASNVLGSPMQDIDIGVGTTQNAEVFPMDGTMMPENETVNVNIPAEDIHNAVSNSQSGNQAQVEHESRRQQPDTSTQSHEPTIASQHRQVALAGPIFVYNRDDLHDHLQGFLNELRQHTESRGDHLRPENSASSLQQPQQSGKRAPDPVKLHGLPHRRDSESVILARAVRHHLSHLTDDDTLLSPLSDYELYKFSTLWEKTNGDPEHDCCTSDDFRIDIVRGSHSPWNLSAARVFTRDFLEFHHIADSPSHRAKIAKQFHSCVKNLKASRKINVLPAKDKKQHKKKVNKQGRKRLLFQRRLEEASDPKYSDAFDRHIPMLMKLGPDGMSSDESDDDISGNKVYRVYEPMFRAPVVGTWLRTFDSLHLISRKMCPDKRGAWPRPRAFTGQLSQNTKFIPGLPQNAYRSAWIADRNDVYFSVHPTSEVFDFVHEPAIYEHITANVTRS